MFNHIPLEESLVTYVWRFFYEKQRYEDLLNIITKDCTNMTDEEWNSSLAYYQNLNQEALISFETAMQTIYEIYAEQIQGRPWYIDFEKKCILFGDISGLNEENLEDYGDFLSKLYNEENPNGDIVRDITF